MESISLIVPVSSATALETEDIAMYRRVLEEQAWVSGVEVILAGEPGDLGPAGEALAAILVPTDSEGPVGRLRSALDAASGDVLVMLDPRRSYTPQAVVQVVAELRDNDDDLAIAVPGRDRSRSLLRSLGRRCLGLAGRLTLGTSDVFSGLMAIRRPLESEVSQLPPPRGSRLVLDLLAWPWGSPRDVPVEVQQNDRLPLRPLRLDDLRQLKRVLDLRFGTFSRLVQFCMVGASGMIVDLTLYAILQLLLPLARAGALSIFIALVWNFTLNRRLTFNDARSGSILRQFLTYALGNALGIAVSLSLRLYLPRQFGFFDQHKLAAAVVGIIVATAISFSMSRWVVFIRRPHGKTVTHDAKLPIEAALPETVAAS